MDSKTLIQSVYPEAYCDKGITFYYINRGRELLGGGLTEPEAWDSAVKVLKQKRSILRDTVNTGIGRTGKPISKKRIRVLQRTLETLEKLG